MSLIIQERKHVALKDEDIVILINSNPATIMTDPEVADKTYIEPITSEIVEKIIKKENLVRFFQLWVGRRIEYCNSRRKRILKNKVELIGAKASAISRAEDRALLEKQ